MDVHGIRKINSALGRMNELLEETSVITITADDVNDLTEEHECSEVFPCGELGEGDEINQFISEVIDQFVEQGVGEEEAQELVFSAMEEFISEGVLEDTPDVDAEPEQKREWIAGFDKLLEQKLGDGN